MTATETTTTPRLHAILADRANGETLTCFTWRGWPPFGIERAKRQAVEFGFTDLTNFRAVPVED